MLVECSRATCNDYLENKIVAPATRATIYLDWHDWVELKAFPMPTLHSPSSWAFTSCYVNMPYDFVGNSSHEAAAHLRHNKSNQDVIPSDESNHF